MELRDNGSGLLEVRRSKTDPDGEGVVLYIGNKADEALRAIRPVEELLDLNAPIFGLSARQIGRRVKAAGPGCGPRRWLHRPQRPRRDGPGPGQERG